MRTGSIGCSHGGSSVEVTLDADERITEVKRAKSFFDGLLVLQGVTVGAVDCPSGNTFYADVKS